MNRLFLCFAMMFACANTATALDHRSQVLRKEFEKMLAHVQGLKADGKIGDFMKYKDMGDYLILWDLGPTPEHYDLIRLFRDYPDGTPNFAVSYYRSKTIIDGRTVIRRFVGPDTVGWRNDTMDYETGEYLGMQGTPEPPISAADRRLIEEWNIQLFE
jgi:hypothetical protein